MIYYECDGINNGVRCGVRVVMAGTSLVRPTDWAEMTIAMGLKPSVVKHLCRKCVAQEERRALGLDNTPEPPKLKGNT